MQKLIKWRSHLYTVLKYLTAALMLFVILYPKFPLFNIPGSQVAIRLEDFLVLITTFVWALIIMPDVNSFIKNNITKSFILFIVAGIISVLSAIYITQTASIQISLLHLIRRLEYMLPLFVGMSVLRKKEDVYFFIRVLAVIVVFAFIYGIGQKHFNWPIITTQNLEYARGQALYYTPGAHLVSTFAGHYDLAGFVVLTSPLFYALLLTKESILKKIKLLPSVNLSRGLLLALILMLLWLLVNAASRISLVSYIGSVSLVLLLLRKYKWIPVIIIMCIIFIMTSSKLLDRYVEIFNVTIQKVLSINVEDYYTAYAQDKDFIPQRREDTTVPTPSPILVIEDRSTSIRLNVEWPRAIRAFTKNPLLGTGYSSISLATDNDYLRMLGEVGLLGFTAFFLLFIRTVQPLLKLVTNFRSRLSNIYSISLLSAIPGILLYMVFIDILEASKFAIIFWLMLGMAIAASQFKYVKKTK